MLLLDILSIMRMPDSLQGSPVDFALSKPELPSLNALYIIFSTTCCLIMSYLQLKIRKQIDIFGVNFIFCTLWISGWALVLDDWSPQIWTYYVINNCLAAFSNHISDRQKLNGWRALMSALMLFNLTVFSWSLQGEGFLYDLAYRLPITVLQVNLVIALLTVMFEKLQCTEGTILFILGQVSFFLMFIDCKIAGSYWPCLYYLVGLVSLCACSFQEPPRQKAKL